MESHTRFMVGNPTVADIRAMDGDDLTLDLIVNRSMLIINDYMFYFNNETDIRNWCNSSLTKWSQNGMVLAFVNDEERDLFLMRWS